MFSLSTVSINPGELKAQLLSKDAGAFCNFEGWVRNHNEDKSVLALEYEAFAAVCQKEAQKIISQAKGKFQIIETRCVHRVGKLNVGDIAVWVGVTAAHRDEAFKACRYIIDEIKNRLPIWKKEYYTNGDSGWVNCEHCGHTHQKKVV